MPIRDLSAADAARTLMILTDVYATKSHHAAIRAELSGVISLLTIAGGAAPVSLSREAAGAVTAMRADAEGRAADAHQAAADALKAQGAPPAEILAALRARDAARALSQHYLTAEHEDPVSVTVDAMIGDLTAAAEDPALSAADRDALIDQAEVQAGDWGPNELITGIPFLTAAAAEAVRRYQAGVSPAPAAPDEADHTDDLYGRADEAVGEYWGRAREALSGALSPLNALAGDPSPPDAVMLIDRAIAGLTAARAEYQAALTLFDLVRDYDQILGIE